MAEIEITKIEGFLIVFCGFLMDLWDCKVTLKRSGRSGVALDGLERLLGTIEALNGR